MSNWGNTIRNLWYIKDIDFWSFAFVLFCAFILSVCAIFYVSSKYATRTISPWNNQHAPLTDFPELEQNPILNLYHNIGKTLASEFGPNFSNWLGLARFCKVRQWAVAWLSERLHESWNFEILIKIHKCQLRSDWQGKAMIGLGSDKKF